LFSFVALTPRPVMCWIEQLFRRGPVLTCLGRGPTVYARTTRSKNLFPMPDRIDIKNLSEQALSSWLEKRGLQAYRAGQILRWIYHRNVTEFSHMTDLAKNLRHWLSDNFTISRFEPETVASSEDGSRKFLFRLSDGHHVETVLIPEREHWTLCISSQVGCAMGCAFCLTGIGGLV